MKFTDKATRPHVDAPVFANMPRDLKELPQWVVWRFVWNGKEWSKVPFNAQTQRPAKTNEASTWVCFDDARTMFEKRKNGFDGVGFVFTAEDPFCGIDFDNCAHGEQITDPLVTEWLEELESYTEQSVSGSGFHTIVRGVCGRGLKKGNFEIYDRGRYFTVSGRVVERRDIQWRQPQIEDFKNALKPETKSPTIRQEINGSGPSLKMVLEKAFKGTNGDALRALYEGGVNGHQSRSEAVASLCWRLTFWTDRNPILLDAAIRGSRLFDSKWDSPRGDGTWGSREIAKAIDNCPEFFNWHEELRRFDGTRPSLITGFSDFMAQKFNDAEELAFHGCAGEVVLVQSVTNHGKSTLIRNSAFCLASGKEFSTVVGVVGEPRKVLLLNLEGAAGRFQNDLRIMSQALSQGELEQVTQSFFPVHAPLVDDEPLSLSRHTKIFEADARVVKPQVIVIDTASAAFTIRNENDNSEVAELMKRLVSLARKLNCVIVLAHHIGKAKAEDGQTREAAHRGRGASAWADAAAAIFNVEMNPSDKNRITVTCGKRKSGENYETVFKLDRETRWLTPTDEAPPKPITNRSQTLKLLETSGLTQMKTSAIEQAMAGVMSRSTVMSCLRDLVKDGYVTQTKRGWWSVKIEESEICPVCPDLLREMDNRTTRGRNIKANESNDIQVCPVCPTPYTDPHNRTSGRALKSEVPKNDG